MGNSLTPKGMRDFLPEDVILRQEVSQTIERVYRKYGFRPIDTPALEYTDTLKAKAGEEVSKQIFVIEGGKLGLRFDLTVPLARVAATNSFPKPFKRYHIAYVWRHEEPQKGRFREFIQADIDIVGTKSMRAEAEILTACREALTELGFKNLKILLNNRKVLNALADKFGIENREEVFRILDKFDKIGKDEVSKLLTELLGRDKCGSFLNHINVQGSNKKKLDSVRSICPEGVKELEEIVSLCGFDIIVDLSLARGLGYYTGPIYEIRASDEIGSVAGGGRYDHLLSVYGQDDAATGISIGFERIITLLKAKEKEAKKTYTKLFIVSVKPDLYERVVELAVEFRKNSIETETDLNERNLKKQFEYANSLSIPYVAVVGEKELKEKKVTIKNMKTGKESYVSIKEAISQLR